MEAKTLQECKDQIAINNGWEDFAVYYYSLSGNKWTMLKFMEDVAKLYASQFKSETTSLREELERVTKENEELKAKIAVSG
jgi:hypothetical protein